MSCLRTIDTIPRTFAREVWRYVTREQLPVWNTGVAGPLRRCGRWASGAAATVVITGKTTAMSGRTIGAKTAAGVMIVRNGGMIARRTVAVAMTVRNGATTGITERPARAYA